MYLEYISKEDPRQESRAKSIGFDWLEKNCVFVEITSVVAHVDKDLKEQQRCAELEQQAVIEAQTAVQLLEEANALGSADEGVAAF